MTGRKPSGTSPAKPSRTSLKAGGDLGYPILAAGLLMVTGVIDDDRLGPAMRAAYDNASNPT